MTPKERKAFIQTKKRVEARMQALGISMFSSTTSPTLDVNVEDRLAQETMETERHTEERERLRNGWLECEKAMKEGKMTPRPKLTTLIGDVRHSVANSLDIIAQDKTKKEKEMSANFVGHHSMENLVSEDVLWDESLLDATLHGAQRYDEPTEPFETMFSRADHAPTKRIRGMSRITLSFTCLTASLELRQRYLSLSDAEEAIRKVIQAQLENAPPRLLDTTTGLLHDRDAQIDAFTTSIQYKELLSLTMKHADLPLERINEVVLTYFRYAMLSHRWERKEPLLHDIEGMVVYNLEPVGGTPKLQSFCKVARDSGIRWAWSDSCCIDKSNNVELQESVNTMFVWYRHSALTIIYLSDVSPSSKSGALARSEWNERGWTVQEFLAPKVVRFYQKDWSLYLDDPTPNHKESITIMQELAHATSIDPQALVAFQPGMRGAREKLQWASTRATTWQEDIAYSLFGIFGVHLPVIYGEKKHNTLGRQEIVARLGDITALDWVRKSSDFNSCLPADITSYQFPPCRLPSLSEDDIQKAVSFLRHTAAMELASDIYTQLYNMSAPHFSNCRLHLSCIVFPVTEVRRGRNGDQTTYVTDDVGHMW